MKNLLLLFFCFPVLAQTDSTKLLDEVKVFVFEQKRSPLNSPDAFIRSADLSRFSSSQFVSTLNSMAGIRMEERSPGSYRIAIRGSSLRAPFGVRNTKVYWNQIPFTDAGNNTYISLLEPSLFKSLTVTKGPSAGIYGAGTGGAILFESGARGNALHAETVYHSLGGTKTAIDLSSENHRLFASFNQQEGYRAQSAMKKQWVSYEFHHSYAKDLNLDVSTYYVDLAYQTPGGLTKAQFLTNPEQARPAAGIFKSAQQQGATFKIKSYGLSARVTQVVDNQWAWDLSQALQVNEVENPTIRNYEIRHEPNYSTRGVIHRKGTITSDLGFEYQAGKMNSSTFGNRNGVKDTLQLTQNTHVQQASLFLQNEYVGLSNWIFTFSGSLSSYWTEYIGNEAIFSPRLAILRKLGNHQSIVAKIAHGYSPPSISEMRPSAGVINTSLKAEKGWNHEITYRGKYEKFTWDLSVYQFNLDETIVVRRAADGSDYFTNAGSTTQQGLELSSTWMISSTVSLEQSHTWQNFRFANGNFLTGTTPYQQATTLVWRHPAGLSLMQNFQFVDYQFLNDSNAELMGSYRLWNTKISYERKRWTLWAAVDNLGDERYCSGPDLNATGGRFYNPSPGRNFHIGLQLNLAYSR
jgi:iron complex outermembrane receptor protein